MDLNPSEEQQQLVDTFSSLYAKESTGERVRAAEPSGFDAALWERLLETGVVEMAVDEGSGGGAPPCSTWPWWPSSTAATSGPRPLIEAQTAARLLARAATGPARELLERALAGTELVTVALHPPRTGHARPGAGRRGGRPGGLLRRRTDCSRPTAGRRPRRWPTWARCRWPTWPWGRPTEILGRPGRRPGPRRGRRRLAGAHGRGPHRAGPAGPRDRGRLREGAARLRRADRLLPGGGPRPGRRRDRGRREPSCSPGRRPGRRARSPAGSPSWPPWPSASRPTRPAMPATPASTTTAATAS